MRKVILYIAMSLDGYIADKNGGVAWLAGQDAEVADEGTYSEFVQGIDTVVMGWNTYAQVRMELSPEWPYEEMESYVITHRNEKSTGNIKFVREEPCELIVRLKEMPGKDIWICGGSSIIQPLVREKLIDESRVSIIPTILGDGSPLFGDRETELQLRLNKTMMYNGIAELVYTRR